jgi:hypothetical protein
MYQSFCGGSRPPTAVFSFSKVCIHFFWIDIGPTITYILLGSMH